MLANLAAKRVTGDDDKRYFSRMARIAQNLEERKDWPHTDDISEQVLWPHEYVGSNEETDLQLFQVIRDQGITPVGDAMRLVRGLADGSITKYDGGRMRALANGRLLATLCPCLAWRAALITVSRYRMMPTVGG